MGDSTEQWRATIGQWSGGRPGQCVTLQHCIAQSSNHIGYRPIRFLVLLSLLVIGCVELNPGPGPDPAKPAASQSGGPPPKFHRKPGTDVMTGGLYEISMAAFLNARALHWTEEFYLASNIDGVGALDDLVFRYNLRNSDVWKTCFIQLKHKKNKGKITKTSLTQMDGDCSLFKYFQSYCQIKDSADGNLKQYGTFDEFEFILYTNAWLEGNYTLKGDNSDPVSILFSVKDNCKYITFVETHDKDIFEFFKELKQYAKCILDLKKSIENKKWNEDEVKKELQDFRSRFSREEIKQSLERLESNPDNIEELVKKLKICNFSLYEEFLGKVKIFQRQSDQKFFEQLIKKELQVACQALSSCANYIYSEFEEGLKRWWSKSRGVSWLSKEDWKIIKQNLIKEIEQCSEPKFQETEGCVLQFNPQYIFGWSEAMKDYNLLNIITNQEFTTLSKFKTHQKLLSLDYKNSFFINLKDLLSGYKKVFNLWPCKWCKALVIDCQKPSNIVNDNVVGTIVDTVVSVLSLPKTKVILISESEDETFASLLREKVGNIYNYKEDNCNLSDLDEKSQKKLLAKTVKFQGEDVALEKLVGTNPPDYIKSLITTKVTSILMSNERQLCVSRPLPHHVRYYIPRVAARCIRFKDDILKLTDKAVTIAVSGLQVDQLKNFIPAGEKICEFVYDKKEINHSFKICSEFSKTGFSAEWENMKSHHKTEETTKPEDVRYVILGDLNPESDFRKLKELCTNAHWIHMEEGSFLWRESNCNIDIIRRNTDYAKCQEYDIERLMEHSDRIMLLVAEPGVGKSTFLSYLEHEIKKLNPSVWVLRINLLEHTIALKNIDFEKDCTEKCKKFLWNAALSPEKQQDVVNLEEQIFLEFLEQEGKMVILLDGFDEISPYYSPKVEMLIRAVRDGTKSKIWVSSRLSWRQKLEDTVINLAFTLQPFSLENQIEFLYQYWNESIKVSRPENLRMFAKEILNLFSKTSSYKNEDFFDIPLHTKMLGKEFVKEAEECCLNGEVKLQEKFKSVPLLEKIIDKKFDIYLSEKNKTDSSSPIAMKRKNDYLRYHKIAALMYFFSEDEVNVILAARNSRDLEEVKNFLYSGEAEQIGIITDIKDGKPHFTYRCFARRLVFKWFTDNDTKS